MRARSNSAIEPRTPATSLPAGVLVPNPKKTMGFHDFDQYERLLTIARKRGTDMYLMVLAGGDAGLRLGEIIALEWPDIDLTARRLTVERSDWLGHVTVPKGGRSRQLPDDAAADGRTEGRSAPARRAGLVLAGWVANHARSRDQSGARRTANRRQSNRACISCGTRSVPPPRCAATARQVAL